MTTLTHSNGSFWDWPETRMLLMPVTAIVCGLVVGNNGYLLDVLATRAGELRPFPGIAPGIDLTRLIAWPLAALGIPPAGALFAASLAALPVLGAMVLRTMPASSDRLFRCMMIGTHPVVLALAICGAGWAAPAFYFLWHTLAELPRRRAQQGIVLVGLAIAFGYVAVPGFFLLLLPLAATLFLCAPPHAMRQHAVPFYLAAFAPVAMVFAAFAYIAWIGSVPWIGTSMLPGPAAPGLILAVAAVICGPGLLNMSAMGGSGPRFAALLSVVFAAAWGADILLIAAMAAMAQGALSARRGERTELTYLSYAGGVAVVIALSMFQPV